MASERVLRVQTFLHEDITSVVLLCSRDGTPVVFGKSGGDA